jgi:hypothetical protein
MKPENRKKIIDKFMEERGYNDLLIDDADILIDNLLRSYNVDPPRPLNGNITKYSILKNRKKYYNMYSDNSLLNPIVSRIDLETPYSILVYIYDNYNIFPKRNKTNIINIKEKID